MLFNNGGNFDTWHFTLILLFAFSFFENYI